MKEFTPNQLQIVSQRPRVQQLESAKKAQALAITPEDRKGANIIVFALEWPLERVWVEKSA